MEREDVWTDTVKSAETMRCEGLEGTWGAGVVRLLCRQMSAT